MESNATDWVEAFGSLPATPAMSLRGGNAIDNHEPAPSFDPTLDNITPDYLEAYFWAIPHLDAESWLFYLPHFIAYSLDNLTESGSNAIDSFLFSLRPPDKDSPRFTGLTSSQKNILIAALDTLAFSEQSAWKDQAMTVLEEYWAPGATYR
jgi:hypothetical protein